MAVSLKRQYEFADFFLDPDKGLLTVDGKPVHLANRPFHVLLYLIENRDRMVNRRELLDAFWDGKDVYDDTLTKCVGAIRKALGDSSKTPRFIESRWAKGYRYIGPLEEIHSPAPDTSVVEIERLRGVKIIYEEVAEQTSAVVATAVNASARAVFSRVAVRSLLVVLAISIVATILYWRAAVKSEVKGAPIRSVAVLPLKNLTGDDAQEYFSEGLTESLISELSKLDGLKVTSRDSAFTFKGKDVDPRDVGNQLGVAAMLEGSVRRSRDTVQVDVRLISTADGSVIWAGDSYNRKLNDILVVQNEIGCRVASELRVRLCGDREPSTRSTGNVEAYQAYLRGLYFFNKETADDIRRAKEQFEHSIALDATYAPAWAKLSQSYLASIWLVPMDPREAIPKAKAAAQKALELDEKLALAHDAMILVNWAEWDWANCTKEIQRAIALDPNLADAHVLSAFNLIRLGQHEEAWREIKHAEELDPLSLSVKGDLGNILYFSRKYDELIEYANGLPEDPNCLPQVPLGLVYMQQGRYDDAIKELEKANRILSGDWRRTQDLGSAYALASRLKDAQKCLDELKNRARREYIPPTSFALVYTAIGKKEEAFKWLEIAVEQHDFTLCNLNREPRYDPLRADPRFAGLLQHVGLPSN